jgi:DivIVA domain-containing protein
LAVFWFLLISLAVVVAAVTLAVVGSGEGPRGTASGGLADVPPDLLDEPLPAERPVARADVDGLRLPLAARGYRMRQVDDVLDRLGAELAERDARIAELESALAGARAAMARGGEPPPGGGQGGGRDGGQGAGQGGSGGQVAPHVRSAPPSRQAPHSGHPGYGDNEFQADGREWRDER